MNTDQFSFREHWKMNPFSNHFISFDLSLYFFSFPRLAVSLRIFVNIVNMQIRLFSSIYVVYYVCCFILRKCKHWIKCQWFRKKDEEEEVKNKSKLFDKRSIFLCLSSKWFCYCIWMKIICRKRTIFKPFFLFVLT